MAVKKVKSLWSIFLLEKKRNTLFAAVILTLNALAAFSEGLSFIFVLASFAALTGEIVLTQGAFHSLGISDHSFLFFLFSAIGLQILRSGTVYFSQSMLTSLTVCIQNTAQKQLLKKIFTMNFDAVASLKKGDLLHQVITPPSFIPMLFDEYNRFITAFLMMGAYLFIMLKISVSLTSCVLLFFSIAAMLQKYFFKAITSASLCHADQISDLSKQTAQNLDGLKQIHIFHRQKQALLKMELRLDRIAAATRHLKKWNALIPSLNDSLGVILVGITLLIGTFFLKQEGHVCATSLFIYLTLSYRMATRLQQVMSAKGMIAYYTGPLKRMGKLLSQKVSTIDERDLEPSVPNFHEELRFKNVSLIYPYQKEYALKNISFSIPKNHIVALVGASGAGKSSLLELLVRLYEPSEGQIQVDEHSIAQFSLASWRNLFGVVTQEPFLFHDTVEENLRFSHSRATFDEIEKACQMAGAAQFIEHLPKKYQTVIGERGYRLSGGERQRIALAQALIRNPQIILLDEATSQLDSQSEQAIQEALFRLRGKKTFLIVAHRLATIQMADEIYVLENGRLIEWGTHQQLLQLGGRYQTFWSLQKLV